MLRKWEGIDESKCNDLAEAIEEFIYEYDTYEARDLYEFREEMLETIKAQLKELTTFQKVYDMWYNDDLTEEFKYEKLGEVLSV